MRWINSEGGPLIILSEDNLDTWKGITGGDAAMTDYHRACQIEDYCGIIRVGDGVGIVLGDEPPQTTWIAIGSQCGVLVRWKYANDEVSVIKHLQMIPGSAFR